MPHITPALFVYLAHDMFFSWRHYLTANIFGSGVRERFWFLRLRLSMTERIVARTSRACHVHFVRKTATRYLSFASAAAYPETYKINVGSCTPPSDLDSSANTRECVTFLLPYELTLLVTW